MADAASVLLVYIVAWFTVTTLIYMRRRSGMEKVVVTPLMVSFKTAFTFESFDKLRGNRVVGLFFDAGILNMVVMMVAAYYVLVDNILRSLETGQRVGVVAPIIPGVTIGFRTFLYILPGLVAAVLLHEAFHAIAARYEGIRVRSTGLMLLLGLIPAAFVEPEEEDLRRASVRARLRVYAAGVLANTLLFLVFAGVLAAITQGGFYVAVSTAPGGVAAQAGLPENILVEKIVVNGTVFENVTSFIEYINSLREAHGGTLRGVKLVVEFYSIDGAVYRVVKPPNAEAIGIYLYMVPRSLAGLGPSIALTAFLIVYYAQAVNAGLAGINAIPIFITDGAQFIYAAVESRLGEKRARQLVAILSALTLALLLPNISL